MVVPAYPGGVVLRLKYNQTSFPAVGFLGGFMFGPVMLLGMLEALRIFGGFDFCPHSIIPVT